MITQNRIEEKGMEWAILNYTPMYHSEQGVYTMKVAENSYIAGYQQCLNDLKEQGMAILEEGERKIQELLQADGAYRHMHWVREHPEYVQEPHEEDKRIPGSTC